MCRCRKQTNFEVATAHRKLMGRDFRHCRTTFEEIAETLLEVLLKVNHGIPLIDSLWEFEPFPQFVGGGV